MEEGEEPLIEFSTNSLEDDDFMPNGPPNSIELLLLEANFCLASGEQGSGSTRLCYYLLKMLEGVLVSSFGSPNMFLVYGRWLKLNILFVLAPIEKRGVEN
jgi:hypothetical protein